VGFERARSVLCYSCISFPPPILSSSSRREGLVGRKLGTRAGDGQGDTIHEAGYFFWCLGARGTYLFVDLMLFFLQLFFCWQARLFLSEQESRVDIYTNCMPSNTCIDQDVPRALRGIHVRTYEVKRDAGQISSLPSPPFSRLMISCS
jgi:hypothetical protein